MMGLVQSTPTLTHDEATRIDGYAVLKAGA